MSAATLESLAAEYEQRRQNMLRLLGTEGDDRAQAHVAYEMAKECFYIASTHGLEAAMLYKLSNGAIDPRT